MSSRSSSRASDTRNDVPLLPLQSTSEKVPPFKFRSYFSRFIYRRVFVWAVASLVAASIVLYSTRDSSVTGATTNHLDHGKPVPSAEHDLPEETLGGIPENDAPPASEEIVVVPHEDTNDAAEEPLTSEDRAAKKKYEEDLKSMPWMRFKHLNGYFHGLKTLVSKSAHVPEYPNITRPAPFPTPSMNEDVPKPIPYIPYDTSDPLVKTCYIDANETIPAPNIYAYSGIPQHFPDPAIGSYEVLGIRDDICFDRFGRYGPYGLGYTRRQGGTGTGLDTESSGSSAVWEESGMIDYENVDWADAQDRCYEANKARFKEIDPESQETDPADGKMARMAVVIRIYTGFKWTEHAILNFRALINEMSLKSGGEYQVHFLLHVRDGDTPIWADDVTVQRLLDANIPPEFQGLVTLWSEPQMKLFYPGHFGEAFSNPSGGDIHGVYRSAHLPLQVFAMQHPEYEHIWNWEMDMRFLGSYYELFDRMGKWAKKQSRSMIWERAARYYIPEHHHSWENFTDMVQMDTLRSGLSTPMGSLRFPGRKSLRFEAKGGSPLPEGCDSMDRTLCGVGEEADLITLNPIFDTDQSGWVFGLDATGYSTTPPPRRAAIVTASRLSRRLLLAMHEEVWRHHHTMFSEMFPPSVAFHHGFKATFAPHPVYLDRAWNPFGSSIDEKFNGGRDHSTSGSGSPFDLANEHNHKGSTWYYNSEFAGLLWRRWLGYAQNDGRGKFGNHGSGAQERGGYKEEKSEDSTGRMCLRSMLVHPIKHEHPSEK